MLKKTVTYIDFNGLERTEDFYFNLTTTEVLELEMGRTGGLAEQLQAIVKANDVPAILESFKKIVLKAYGEKSADGRRFMKTPEITAAFAETQAYSDIFMELSMDADAAAKFINGIIPPDLAEKAKQQNANHPALEKH